MEDTLAFFKRFDRVIINGKPWEVQAYNENYSTSKTKGMNTGIIRVALKETYTTTDQFIKEMDAAASAKEEEKTKQDELKTQPWIDGSSVARPYDKLMYQLKNVENINSALWGCNLNQQIGVFQVSSNPAIVYIALGNGILDISQSSFDIWYGQQSNPYCYKHIQIKSL